MGMRVSKDLEERILAAAIPSRRKPAGRSKYRAKAVFRCPDGTDVVRVGLGYETTNGVPVDPAGAVVKVADSLKEYRRRMELVRDQAMGVIGNLRFQVPFVLHGVNGAKLCRYVADFVYVERGQLVVEDTKGVLTAMYKLKKKMLADEYGIAIRET